MDLPAEVNPAIIRFMAWTPKDTAEHLIGRAARLLTRVGDARLKALGLTGAHLPVFAVLKDGAALSQAALAKVAKVEQPTMAATLARMERDGLIRREPDPADRRSTRVRLTPEAIAKLPDLMALRSEFAEEALEGFDEAERKLLAGMLMRIIANVEGTAKGCDAPEDGGRGLS